MPHPTLVPGRPPAFDPDPIVTACAEVRRTAHVVREGHDRDGVRGGRIGVALDGEPVRVSATCPDRRSSEEPGGAIYAYRGAVFAGDDTALLDCEVE